MMKKWTVIALAALLCSAPVSGAGELRLSIANGRVTIVARDVPLRQILDEWGRVGQTRVVGADRLAGPSITLELHDVPEGRALETLLRSASGYIAKPRVGTLGASAFDSIVIMPPSRAPAISSVPSGFNSPRTLPTPVPAGVMPPLVLPPMPADEPDDDGEDAGQILPPGALDAERRLLAQPPTSPGFQPAPQPMQTAPRPGMLPPSAPGMPGNPYQVEPREPAVIPPAGATARPGGRGGAQ
jgi:hypothetical protein